MLKKLIYTLTTFCLLCIGSNHLAAQLLNNNDLNITFANAPIFISEIDLQLPPGEAAIFQDEEYPDYVGQGRVCTTDELIYGLPFTGGFSYQFVTAGATPTDVNWTFHSVFFINQQYTWEIPDHPGKQFYIKFTGGGGDPIVLGPFNIIDCGGKIIGDPIDGDFNVDDDGIILIPHPTGNKTDITEESITELKMQIGPNPVVDNLNIHYTTNKEGTTSIYLYDATGRLVEVVQEQVNNFAGTHNIRYNAANLGEGLYIVEMRMNETSKYFKVYKAN